MNSIDNQGFDDLIRGRLVDFSANPPERVFVRLKESGFLSPPAKPAVGRYRLLSWLSAAVLLSGLAIFLFQSPDSSNTQTEVPEVLQPALPVQAPVGKEVEVKQHSGHNNEQRMSKALP